MSVNKKKKNDISKTMSLLLRHNPDNKLNIQNDGFVLLDELINILNSDYKKELKLKDDIDREVIKLIVEENNKQRFTITNSKIRANQGHSIEVKDLTLYEIILDDINNGKYKNVIHGTTKQNYELINQTGELNKMSRQHIHLANGISATSGIRKNCQVIIGINTEKYLKDSNKLYESSNGVILTEGPISKKYFSKVEYINTDNTDN